ncbi:MAG: hypothetical protein C0597_04730 [Marinilabiliales bacterium]|nr:MAG: hypothetical protein C0597_04730 [Marinilabiliales bacterium]
MNWDDSDPSAYIGKYPVIEGDPDQQVALDLFNITLTDDAGNVSNSLDGDVTLGIDAHSPSISGVTASTTGGSVLKVGDKVNFVVTIVDPEYGLIVSPTVYNTETLTWSTTNGSTYTSTYTVAENDPELTEIQLTGVTVTDVAGNTSASDDSNTLPNDIDSDPPVINDVSVPTPETMIYGQTYTITITINSDANNLSLVSGTIAGFNLFNLNYVNATTYEADFTVGTLGYDILDGDSYNVTNLVLSDFAGNLSNPFNKTVTQAGDPMYTILPTAKVKGKYNVCDKDSAELVIQLTGYAPWDVDLYDGSTTTTITDIPESPFVFKVEALDANGLVDPDTVIYKITQVTDDNGNNKIMAGTDSAMVFAYELPLVDITDPPGNKTYNIAASADTLVGIPVGGVFSGNGIISSNNTFLASSAGLGAHKIAYTYTIPATGCWSSDTVEFEVIESNADITFDNGDDDWRCDYETTMTVTAEVITDPLKEGVLSLSPNPAALIATGVNEADIDITQLTAGTYEVSFEYDDGGTIVVTRSFTVESVSSSIDITDIIDQCADYDTIFVNAFNLTPSGGTGNFLFSGAGTAFEYDPTDIKNNKGYLLPEEISQGSYNLQYVYTTPNGCDSDPVIKAFDVYALPVVTLSMNSVYNIDQGETTIVGDPADAGGSFYPAFMNDNNDGTAQFDPADAGLGTYWVKYVYEDANGCVDVDSTQIEVNQALGEITSSTGLFQFCYYGATTETITGTPNPTDGTPGSFYIDDVLITPLSDNVISFNPQDYTAGDHQLRFEYSNSGTDYQVFKSINIDSIGTIYFTGLDAAYCESENIEVKLTAFYPGLDGTMDFIGNGITDNLADNLGYFNPSNANLGNNLITYTYTRDYSGCQKAYNESVKINNTPTVAFYPNANCVVNPSDPLGFTSDTLVSDSIVSWDWTYRTNYKDFNQFPTFTQTVPGYNSMKLKLTSKEGCVNEIDSSFYIGTRVDLKFTFENECHGETVLFDLITASDTEDTLSTNWEFGGSGISDLSIRTKPTFEYSSPGAYDVIYEEYTKSCGRIADTVRINIRPSIDLSSGSYIDEFEDSPSVTGWVIEDYEDGANNTWQWGEPTGTKINTAPSGTNVYATNLSGNYENDEKGMITSPCFDFSMVERPMLKMDYISYTETDRDGAVIQYTKPNGDWATIGVPSDGISWYNSYIISGAPANQQLGWTGQLVNTENTGWNTAMFRLDELRGRAGVRFRIVFGSNGDFTDEGFAFDNIQFKERERMVLLENFTNMADEDANNIQDNIIRPILNKDSLDVIHINYHNGFPSSNSFYTYYPSGPSARALYYGVSDVPYSIVDGLGQFDYSVGGELEESDVHKRVLVDPPFSISLKQDQQGGNLVVSAYIKALESIMGHDIIVHTAIVERTVIEESENYYNVLRTMLPDAAGSLIERDWLTNDSVNVYKTWTIPVGEVNVDSLITIVFLQDDETKEIYQTAYANDFTTITSIEDFNESIESYDYRVYPNPVKEILILELLKDITFELDVNIYNGIGSMVRSSKLLPGENRIEINTNDLPGGVYYLRITNEEQIIESKKIIKID